MTKTRRTADDPDEVRMTIGEHLDELRGCLLRAIGAIIIACLACIYPARWLFTFITAPAIVVLQNRGQDVSFLQTHPTEGILIYVKVVLIAGCVLAGPYAIYEVWQFIAAGLYRQEREWVRRLVWPSIVLFLTGVVFMYVLVLPVALNFLVGFTNFLPAPDVTPGPFTQRLINWEAPAIPATRPATSQAPQIPFVLEDPHDPPVGHQWFNVQQRRWKLRGVNETYSVPFKRDVQQGLLTTHFKIGEYLSFVLMLTIAFGLAFQMPLVVVFLVRSGIASAEALRKSRKMVILIIVIIAGILAPPDVLSHLLLSGPMIILFEIGLMLATRRRPAAEAPEEDGT